jgi:polyisoprenoid-binding protein YceI
MRCAAKERGVKTVIKRIVALAIVSVVIALGVVAYAFLRPPEKASGPVEAVPVSGDQPASGDSTQITAANPGAVIFEIVQTDSEVRFIIDEVLNGAPNTVVGTTDQVAGEIAIDVDEPSRSQIGTILVNARTLVTDNGMRNRAIKNRILSTDAYEFITFAPTGIAGLPDSVGIGESFSFQVTGDLTVRDVTRQVTFDAVVSPISDERLEGTASTTVRYADLGLAIPQVPSVASVSDDVILEMAFVAAAK